MPVGISRLPASSVPSLEFIWLKENLENSLQCHSSGPGVPGLLVFFSLPFRGLCFLYMMPMFFTVLSGRERHMYFYAIFLEEVPHCHISSFDLYATDSLSVKYEKHLPHGVVQKIKQEHM